MVFDLPEAWDALSEVSVESVSVHGQSVPHRLIAFAVEQEGADKRLHVQVDMESTGYLEGPLRAAGATIRLTARR